MGNMFGAVEFFAKASRYTGIGLIIGYDAYLCPGSRHDRKTESGRGMTNYRIGLLAKDNTGYKNLMSHL